MADGIQINDSQLLTLATDLAHVPEGAGRRVVQAVEVSARNIRDGWREQLEGSETIPQGARAVSYDLSGSAVTTIGIGNVSGATAIAGTSEVVAEIGPSLGSPQGPIVGLVEEGSATIAPRGYGAHQLAAELAGFEAGLAKAVGDPL